MSLEQKPRLFPKGLIISFEGLDCCFKETNYTTFLERMHSYFNETIDTNSCIYRESFPRYGNPICYPIDCWLKGKWDRNYIGKAKTALSSLYAIDRMDYWHKTSEYMQYRYGVSTMFEYMKKYKNSTCFVFDRYTMSNIFYNSLSNPITEEEISYEQDHYVVPNPDIMVWLRASKFEFIAKNLAAKKNKDENELDLSFLRGVWERSENIMNNYLYKFENCGIYPIVITVNEEDLTARYWDDIADEIDVKVYNKIYDLIGNKEM